MPLWYDKATKPKEWRMQVMWGAWVKKAIIRRKHPFTVDIQGIYEQIWKHEKADFPFSVDLTLLLVYQITNRAEFGQVYKLALDFRDKYGIDCLFRSIQPMQLPEGDLPVRWYETYAINNVVIKQPDDYAMNIYINQEFKQLIPLWVIAPKVMTWDDATGTTTEMWPEEFFKDFDREEQQDV